MPRQSGAVRIAVPTAHRQAITYHGLTVDVPTAWKINDYACGPKSDTVLLPGPRDACGPPPQTVTTVEFVGWPSDGLLPAQLTSSAGRLDGTPATLTSGWRANSGFSDQPGPRLWVRAITVPAVRAMVVVTSPDRATADQIADTARLVDVDSAGCDVVAADTLALPPANSGPVPAGAASAVIPGQPSVMSICRYDNGLLEHGFTLPAADAGGSNAATIEELQAMLARAPVGTYRIPPDTYSGDICRDPALPVGEVGQEWDDGEGYRLAARYLDGTSLTAIARINLCGDLGVSNGWHTVQPTAELAAWLARLDGSGGYVGPLPGETESTVAPTS